MAGKKEKEKHWRIIIITTKQQKCKSDAIDENTNNENTNDAMKDSMKEKEDSKSESNVDVSKGLKCLLTVIIPILTTLVSIATVWFRYYYVTEAESFYRIEKSLFYTVIGSEDVLSLIQNVFLILFPICLIFLYFILDKKFSIMFGFCTVLVSAIYPFIVIRTIIEYFINWNQILTIIVSFILALTISILGTIAFWLMYLDETKSKINWRDSTIRELLNNSNNDNSNQNSNQDGNQNSNQNGNQNSNQNKRSRSRFYNVCFLAALFIIISFGFIEVASFNNIDLPSNKKTYEIVQNLPSTDMQAGKRTLKARIQVVILHRGSQVLLMNGKIDGNETINPQEDMSSSNLVIDTSSYEFQEASQYRFYRKEFNDVKPDPPPKK